MELSAPLRWLGALAVMLVVVVIVVPMLLDTIGDTVVLGEEATAGPSETAQPSEVASEGGGGGDGDGRGGDGEAADVEFPAEYTVGAGDTGAAISEQFYGNPGGWEAIAEANDIDPTAPLRVGEELTIPPPE